MFSVFCNVSIMNDTSYYSILGISRNASKDQIKSAFRRLALKYHPDKNVNTDDTESAFIVINNAYQILINDENRREYDNFINKERPIHRPAKHKNDEYNPIIRKTLSEFNYLLWDIDDILRKISDGKITLTINDNNLFDYLLDFFRYLEKEILHEHDRFMNFKGKKEKIKLHLENYFTSIRLEIDKYIISLDPNDTDKLKHLLHIKKEMMRYIGEFYRTGIFERINTASNSS
jgi:DnaJ-class molecular chaperone